MTQDLQLKIQQSKQFLSNVYNSMDNLWNANSGGKDSLVVYTLIKELGLPIKSFHNNTTIDPKGTMQFIRQNMSDTIINQPKETFYQLVERKGLPTRLNRFCCEILKESSGKAINTIEGVRAAESRARSTREPITCDTRKSMKNSKHIYPILYWSDKDIWNFIHDRNLQVAPCYEYFDRLGCVGCPLVNSNKRIYEFSHHPKILKNIEKAIGKGMNNNPQWKLTQYSNNNAELAIKWWLTGLTMQQFFTQYELEFNT